MTATTDQTACELRELARTVAEEARVRFPDHDPEKWGWSLSSVRVEKGHCEPRAEYNPSTWGNWEYTEFLWLRLDGTLVAYTQRTDGSMRSPNRGGIDELSSPQMAADYQLFYPDVTKWGWSARVEEAPARAIYESHAYALARGIPGSFLAAALREVRASRRPVIEFPQVVVAAKRKAEWERTKAEQEEAYAAEVRKLNQSAFWALLAACGYGVALLGALSHPLSVPAVVAGVVFALGSVAGVATWDYFQRKPNGAPVKTAAIVLFVSVGTGLAVAPLIPLAALLSYPVQRAGVEKRRP